MKYQLELKQLVEYPRCRIYRNFIRTLTGDRSIRTNGNSYLFYFMLLCSYANYRTSHRRLEGVSYTLTAGEWICPLSELQDSFRLRFQHQVLSILQFLEEQHYITYSVLGKNRLIKFSIQNWQKDNTVLGYSYPCKKETGFFFFPISKVHELIGLGKCSEMDILLDMWIHAIYNDTQVTGSDLGPVVYFRNCTGNPLTNYTELAERWGRSRSTVHRILKKLESLNLLTLVPFAGSSGSIIYLKNYLSTMFSISDVMIDKEEVALALSLPVHLPDDETAVPEPSISDQIVIPNDENTIPKPYIKFVIGKVADLLQTQGLPCCQCKQAKYQLSKLSDSRRDCNIYSLQIICPYGNMAYQFEMTLIPRQEPHTFFHTIPTTELKGEDIHA